MESDDRLGKLREKLKEIVDHIEEADQCKVDSHHAHVEAMGRYEKLEVDHQSEKRRKQLLSYEVEDVEDRLEVSQDKLRKTEKSYEEEDEAREVLEAKEAATESRIEKLESKVKNMKRTVELNEATLVDGERKIQVYKNDFIKLQEKAEAGETRIGVLEWTITNHGKQLDKLEEREGAAGEREALHEDKIHFLVGQVKELELRADAAERANAVGNSILLETKAEIASWAKKIHDMEVTMVKMDDLADDPAYDLSKRYQKKPSLTPLTAKALSQRSSFAMQGSKQKDDDEMSVSSVASSRAGRQIGRPPKSPEPEPEPESKPEVEESEDESDEESEEEPEPVPEPEPEPESKPEVEELEDESDEDSEEESGDED